MKLYTRVGMYLFILGTLLSVLDGVYPFEAGMRGWVYIILIFTGIFAGLMNITEDEEHHFLISSVAFLLTVLVFSQIFAGAPFIVKFAHFFQNAVAFVGSMALIVALKTIIEFGADDYRVTPLENMTERTAELDDLRLPRWKRRWYFILFIAVAATFLIILFEIFYDLSPLGEKIVLSLGWLITAIFAVDLVILFRDSSTFNSFLRLCWLDILAAIPFGSIFSVLKIVRLARLLKVTKSLKFFSEKSGHNIYLRQMRKQEDEKVTVVEHPKAAQRGVKSRN